MNILLAGCVITNDLSEVLLIHRQTSRLTQWELPGGKVEPGETLDAAAIREVYEEVLLQVSGLSEFGSTVFFDNGSNWEYHWFKVQHISGTPKVGEPDKFDDLAYVDLFDEALVSRLGVSINIAALISALHKKHISL